MEFVEVAAAFGASFGVGGFVPVFAEVGLVDADPRGVVALGADDVLVAAGEAEGGGERDDDDCCFAETGAGLEHRAHCRWPRPISVRSRFSESSGERAARATMRGTAAGSMSCPAGWGRG